METQTNGYTLIDAGIGTSFKVKNGKIKLWITGQNLGDKLYFSTLGCLLRLKSCSSFYFLLNPYGVKTPKDIIIKFPCLIQPKINGVRATISLDDLGNVQILHICHFDLLQ